MILIIASHLPKGALLTNLTVDYDQTDHMIIDMTGNVYTDDPNEQIALVEQVFSDFKSDKDLAQFVTKVNLVSLNRQEVINHQVTVFTIHCS